MCLIRGKHHSNTCLYYLGIPVDISDVSIHVIGALLKVRVLCVCVCCVVCVCVCVGVCVCVHVCLKYSVVFTSTCTPFLGFVEECSRWCALLLTVH